jgi:hypothetical protein
MYCRYWYSSVTMLRSFAHRQAGAVNPTNDRDHPVAAKKFSIVKNDDSATWVHRLVRHDLRV